MKTILVINDNAARARHAAGFALLLAQKMEAKIILANNFINATQHAEMALAGKARKHGTSQNTNHTLLQHLNLLANNAPAIFKPEIEELGIAGTNEKQLAEIINLNHIWMIVKGMPDNLTQTTTNNLNIHTLLNKVACPLLLIPANWQIKEIERMVYLADLRYCRVQIVRYLAALAKPWHASFIGCPYFGKRAARYGRKICT